MSDHGLEATLLGSLLLRSDAIYELPASFSSRALGHPVAKKAFEVIARLAEDKEPIDLALVTSEAGFSEQQASWLRVAVTHHATTNSVAPYAERLLSLHRRAYLRGLMRKAHEDLGTDRSDADILAELHAKLSDADHGDRAEVTSFAEVAQAALHETVCPVPSVKTGFQGLDQVVRIRPGNLVIVAAQTGMGKSTLVANIAENVAARGEPVLVHSLEMDDRELWAKVTSRALSIPADALLGEDPLRADERKSIRAYADSKRHMPLYFNSARHSLGEVCRITEKWNRKVGLKLVVVDYLQLLEVDTLGKNATDENRIGTASRTLKLLAQRLQVPLIAVAQLNREPDRRQVERKGEEDSDRKYAPPKLSDLRGSGRIEQDANTVLFLHNPHATSKDRERAIFGPYRLTVAKQRLGGRGHVDLRADLAFSKFTDMQGVH